MVSYDMQTIGYINLFEKLTRAMVKDCFFEDNMLVFVVQPGQIGKAIGKSGINIRKVGNALKKQIKIIEFNPAPSKFAENLLYPIRPEEVRQEDDLVIIKAHDHVEKGRIFGREKTNLKKMQDIMSKYFPIQLKVE
jgi:N utilization substance protein A